MLLCVRLASPSLLAVLAISCAAPSATAPATGHRQGESAAQHHMHKRSFEQLVERFEAKARAEWQFPERVIASLGPIEGKVVADLGAGTGYFSFRLAAEGAQVLALDVDPRFIRYLRQRANREPKGAQVVARQTSPADPGLESASVDRVLVVDVYHHIERRPDYFAKVRAALRPGGALVIVDFKPGSFEEGPPDALKVAPDLVMRELSQAGFTAITLDSDTLPRQFIVRARTE